MITAKLAGREFPVIGFDLKYAELKIPEFTLEVAATDIDAATVVFQDIKVFKDGEEIASGIVSETPLPDMSDGGIVTYKLKCDTDLGRLYLEMAADIQFQNLSVSTIVSTLLGEAVDSVWSINSSVTLAAENLTLDPRDKESLWAQIKYALDSASDPTFIRYAGFSAGSHQIDIGSFGSDVRTHNITQGNNLVGKPKFKQIAEPPIKEIRPISGRTGAKPVLLSEALALEPGLSSDPDYPLNVSNQSVVNDTITTGRRLRKRFTGHKTSNTAPVTAAARREVALSLYYSAVREIRKADPHEEIRCEAFFTSPPPLYDNIYVDIVAYVMKWNPLTEREEVITPVVVQGWYRVKGYQLKYSTNLVREDLENISVEGDLYSVELTSGTEVEAYEEKSDIVKKSLTTNDLEDNTGVILGVLDTVDVPIFHSNVAADCNYAGANTGKSFEFPLPSVPSGATDVTTEVISTDPATVNTATVIQAATLLLPLILCVSGPGGANWTITDDVTVTVRYTFTG